MFKLNINKNREDQQVKTDMAYFSGFPLKQYQSILERYYLYRDEINEYNYYIDTDKKVLDVCRDQKKNNEEEYIKGKICQRKYFSVIERLNNGIDHARKSQSKNMEKLLDLEIMAKKYKDRYLMLINEDFCIKKYGASDKFKDPFTTATKEVGLDQIYWTNGYSTDILSSSTETDKSEEMELSEEEDIRDLNQIPTTDTIYHEWKVDLDLNK